jgi:peptidoglycan-associated lipoprotein
MVTKLTGGGFAMRRFFVFAAIMAVTAFGCAEKKAVVPMQQDVQPQTRAEEKKAPEKITEQQMAKVESADIASKMDEVRGMFGNIQFDYDKYIIREDAKPILKSVADYLLKNTAHKVLIEGHCDERGTSEYNLGLGDRRAKSAQDYLVSLGIPSSRIETISYGKEKPLCTEQTEPCWAKNRRDQFVILKAKK